MHKHTSCNEHKKDSESIKYCKVCDTFYCEECGAEWTRKVETYLTAAPYMPVYRTSTIDCRHSEGDV